MTPDSTPASSDAPARDAARETGAPLTILAPTRYPWRFNSPRTSRHTIVRRNFLPLNYLSPRLEGITVFPPISPKPDLIHAFNRIPLAHEPFVIGFESHLPRGFGIEDSRFFNWMTSCLVSDRCRAIVAISDFAKRMFLHQQAGHRDLEVLRAKLSVRLPSVVMPDAPIEDSRARDLPLRLLFVGNHFARKGGLVALRMAELAEAHGLSLEVEIVSKLEMGAVSWTDPTDPAFFERYKPLLGLPNVKVHGSLPNEEVLSRIRAAHFLLLPTFGDTFGYSAIEALMQSTPVIATAQCALPEFIEDGVNGYLLDLPTTEAGEWVLLGHGERDTAAFAKAHAEQVDDLADQALQRLARLMQQPNGYADMTKAARASAVGSFDAAAADPFWDDLYQRSLADHR